MVSEQPARSTTPKPVPGVVHGIGEQGLLDRMGLAFTNQPMWFALVVALALLLLPVAVWLDLRTISSEALSRQATDLNVIISEIRSYYARNVIARVADNGGQATPTHNYKSIKGGIPIPATLSLELGDVIGKRGENIKYRFVSDAVFKGRKPHILSTFEQNALTELRYTGSRNDSVTKITGALLDRKIEMAVPVIMGEFCVTCHNSHPQTPKTDWRVGDIRGIQSITVQQPIAANLFSFKFLMLYLIGAGTFGLFFTALQWRQAKQFSLLNNELEEANSFLASISMKISKYLSPQIYKSIFSGEKDAVISTERKKLTIFFSDIKDFTSTTEELQPEALTELLNEYFTEMSNIAHEYGATVDKFIGDAILVFFGDPKTNGPKQDAIACLEMAIAMQERMNELNFEWRNRGIEKPFRIRMGINTGYCNVGNFGSADRMDYTIIGAEANLAARLESIAKPGGIVLSYETFALVKDIVDADPMEAIQLKGISREIVPYLVSGRRVAGARGFERVVNESTDRMHLHIDLDNVDGDQVQEIESKLKSALKKVKTRRTPSIPSAKPA